jgi:aminoglycoside phosphotransferase (APT) family kinase protein
MREARTLEALKNAAFVFETPELICIVKSELRQPIGLIENWVWGMSLHDYREGRDADKIISTIAAVAVAVHRLPTERFSHLPAFPDCRSHILYELKSLPPALFREYPAAQAVRKWIFSRLPTRRPAAVLHGDLLPQNIHGAEDRGEWKVAVIDWEFAEIGDPALDLAIVTRGDRRFMGKNDALRHLVDIYRSGGGSEISVADVHVHELLLCLKRLWSSSRRRRRGLTEGHGPEHHARRVNSLLRRAREAA